MSPQGLTKTKKKGKMKSSPAFIQEHNQVRDAHGLHCTTVFSLHLGTWGSVESKPGFGGPRWTVAPRLPLHRAGGPQLSSERALVSRGQPGSAVASFLQRTGTVASFPWTSASKNWTSYKSGDSALALHRTQGDFIQRTVHIPSDRTGGADTSLS